MVTNLEKIRWKLFDLKSEILFLYGVEKGLIRGYDRSVIEKSKKIRCGGIPLSILLLERSLANGKCYNRAALLTLCFPDDSFRVITAEIDELKYNPFYINEFKNGRIDERYVYHCFVERTMEDGSVWVYDTSNGLMYEKSLYYRMENPRVINEKSREEILEYLKTVFIVNRKKQNIETIKEMLDTLQGNLSPIQFDYTFILEEEIKRLYDSLELIETDAHGEELPKKIVLTRNEDD